MQIKIRGLLRTNTTWYVITQGIFCCLTTTVYANEGKIDYK